MEIQFPLLMLLIWAVTSALVVCLGVRLKKQKKVFSIANSGISDKRFGIHERGLK